MHYLDLATIALYLIAITWFGAHFRKSQHSLKDYFLGGRNAPWWAIALSIVSAETSTLTVIGTPALSFSGNFQFLQLVLGYLLARIVISVLFLPQYFRGEMFTAYELMRRRFGERIRRLTAGTFLVLRALAEGVRVFALSIVISIVLGTGEIFSILVIVCLTLFYTFEGGLTAVIWTDAVQMFLYVGGAILSFWVILHQIPGGWSHVSALAGAAHKFQMFDFRFSWTPEFFSRSYSFWAGLIGGCFLTTASHGTEQLMVQRLLAAKNERQSRAALLSSWVVIFFQFALFLFIGVLLFVHYSDTRSPAPQPADSIYPKFVWNSLPTGAAGLVIAAILAAGMSNLSAALNALASTTVMDFYKPLVALRNPQRSPAVRRAFSRRRSLGHGGVGRDSVSGGISRAACGIGARSRLDHCVHLVWLAPGSVLARAAHQTGPTKRRHDRDDRGLGAHDLHSLRDQHRLHLVRRHRNRGNIFDRLRNVAILERTIE